MLPLDSPRWAELDRQGSMGGSRDDGRPPVVTELAALLADPSDSQRFESLSSRLCPEGMAWPVAYAVAGYLVELARRQPDQAFDYLYVVALIRMSEAYEIPDDLFDDYTRACDDALAMLAGLVTEPRDDTEFRELLAALASLSGKSSLGNVINELDAYGRCPQCDTELFNLH